MTSDDEGAADFDQAVVGWSFSAPDPQSPMDYRMIARSDCGANGGVLTLIAEMQA
jgi:predicted enzyme related to lactoylglutathione lyase